MIDIKKPQVDAVLVGFGWTGAIMGMELTEAGLKVVALDATITSTSIPPIAMSTANRCCA
jgi:choline dehydrogenase-like flavoprotein